MLTTSPTPQPFRYGGAPGRNSYESELWDEMSNVVYGTTSSTITVPMPVAGRLEIQAQATLNAGGNLTISVDSIPATSIPVSGAAGPLSAIWYVDVPVGNHVVAVTSPATLTNLVLIIRRGRTPVTA